MVKNEGGDQFVVKKLSANQDNSKFLLDLNHPHIVQHKEFIKDSDNLYLVLEDCEGGDLAQKIKNKKEGNATFSEHEKHPIALDRQECASNASKWGKAGGSLHSMFQRTGLRQYGSSSRVQDPPMGECGSYPAILTIETVQRILTSSYEPLPETFSEDLRQLVADTLQPNPENRPSVSEILTRPFIISYLREKNMQTIKTLYRTLEELRALADDLERVHFNTTVGSLTGGVIGLTGGIASVVGLVLSPFTLGASLIVTGVGIGTAVAGGVTAGVSNITNMVNQKTNRQKIRMLIKEFQEKITSTVCCIENIQIAVETLERQFSTSDDSFSNAQTGANAGARLGRGLGGIPEILRVIEVVNVGKAAAHAARAIRVAEAATGVLSALFVAVDVFFVFLDSREFIYISMNVQYVSTLGKIKLSTVVIELFNCPVCSKHCRIVQPCTNNTKIHMDPRSTPSTEHLSNLVHTPCESLLPPTAATMSAACPMAQPATFSGKAASCSRFLHTSYEVYYDTLSKHLLIYA
ncbi:hypothetical protein QQF64_023957 [Cirrhinus molitorella]|uniref:Protein kinase domain-containing protein n=1 Tax=Cirrhinus molitorella TaxID=172907 RepID=A0ABR3NK36_9TELE